MAAHFTISKGQADALRRFLEANVDPEKDVPKLLKQFGADDTLKLIKLQERLARNDTDQ